MSPGSTPLGDADRRRASEKELLALAGDGDRDATAELVQRFTPLVRRIAGRLHSPGGAEELEDLIQVGQIGLLEAVSRYESDRGAFAPYASVTISGTIKRHFRDRSWKVRIPRSLHDAAQKVGVATGKLEARLGRPPTERELADETGIDRTLLRETQTLLTTAHPLSLQAPAAGELPELGETLGGDDAGLTRAETRSTIRRLSSHIDPRDRRILALRFGLDRTQVEIAEAIGVSQMQVSRLLRRALSTMRANAAEGDEPAENTKVAA